MVSFWKSSPPAPVAELADAHDSGSCARNGRGGSTPLRGIEYGLLTVLFYCPCGFFSRQWHTVLLEFYRFACLVCHFFRLHLVELIEVVIVDLSVVVVLNFDGMADPARVLACPIQRRCTV